MRGDGREMLWRLHSFSKPVSLGYFSSRYDIAGPFLLIFEPMFDGRALSRYSSPSVACMTVFIINSSPKFTLFFFRWSLPDYVRFLPPPNFVCSSVSDKRVL